MANAYIDNRYFRVGPHSSKYYVVKNSADKVYLEFDLSDFLAHGRGNASNLTIAMSAWTPSANAPTLAASGAGHTPSMVRMVLSAGNAATWAGGGGYPAGQGAIAITVTIPDTSEVKEILLVVTLQDITSVTESTGIIFDKSIDRYIKVNGNLQSERLWLEPGETLFLVLDLSGWLADRASATAITGSAVSFATWPNNASGATAPTAGTVAYTTTTCIIPFSLIPAASMGSGNGGYRGQADITLTMNAAGNTEEIRKIHIPLATALTA